MAEQDPVPLTEGDADIRIRGLPGPVDGAAHDRDLEIPGVMAHMLVHIGRDGGKVHPGPAAGGTGDDLHVVLADADGRQYLLGRQHLLYGIAGEAHPDGVADAVHEKAPDARGRLDEPRLTAARLGDAHVEGVVHQLVEPAHGRHGIADVGVLHGDDRVVETLVFQQPHVVEGALHHGGHGIVGVVRTAVLVEGAAVDADADGDMMGLAAVHHRLHSVGGADVARVDAELFAAVLHGGDGQPVIKMYVCHKRQVDPVHDVPDRPGRVHIEHGGADDLAARRLQPVYLLYGGLCVPGVRVGHGLDGHRGAAAHGHAAHKDLSRHIAILVSAAGCR